MKASKASRNVRPLSGILVLSLLLVIVVNIPRPSLAEEPAAIVDADDIVSSSPALSTQSDPISVSEQIVPADILSVSQSAGAPGANHEPSYVAKSYGHFLAGVRRLLGVQAITIAGRYHVAEQDLLGVVRPAGQQLWAWDYFRRDIEADIKRNPWIEKARVRWSYFPFQIAIEVEEADPWMVVEYGETSWLLSRSGKLLQPVATLSDSSLIVEASTLPRLDGIDNRAQARQPHDGSPLSPRLNYALRILRLVELAGGLPLEVDRFTLLPEGGVAAIPQLPHQPVVVMEPETFDDAIQQLQSLALVMRDLQSRKDVVRQIDLRFKNRAIVS